MPDLLDNSVGADPDDYSDDLNLPDETGMDAPTAFDIEADEQNGGGGDDGVYSIDYNQDDNNGNEDDNEDAPINPTAANKEQRKQRYFGWYFLIILRYSALGIAAVGMLCGLFFFIQEMMYVNQLEKENTNMTTQILEMDEQIDQLMQLSITAEQLDKNNTDMVAQISEMTERIDQLKQGLLVPPPRFVLEQIQCDTLSDLDGTYSDSSDKKLPRFGCVSNAAASTLLEAQVRVKKWSEEEAPPGIVGGTPDWIKRRVADYGIWLYPRLKLVLLSCPKCGNSQSRTMLTVLSSMAQRTTVGNTNNLEDVLNWSAPVGSWVQESTDSWRLAGTFKGADSKGMTSGDDDTVAAFQLIDELMAGGGTGNGGKWSSLAIVRHPYERFIEAYAELETQWSRLADDAPQHTILNARPFSKMKVGSWERVQAFFADFVLGYLSVKDDTSSCLVPTLPELSNIVPTAPGYMRTGSGSGSYYSAERVISIDQIHSAWPDLLDAWGFDSKNLELLELADVRLNASGGSSREAAKAARDLLASDEEFRSSVDAFYAQDFSCFGFHRGQDVLGVPAVKNPVAETSAPTRSPVADRTSAPTPAPMADDRPPEPQPEAAEENAEINTQDNELPGSEFYLASEENAKEMAALENLHAPTSAPTVDKMFEDPDN